MIKPDDFRERLTDNANDFDEIVGKMLENYRILYDTVADIAYHGTRCDLMPTKMYAVEPTFDDYMALDYWWGDYLRRADSNVRNRAKHALEQCLKS